MNVTETGQLIAKLRKENGFTQIELANQLNVTDKAVSKWERGICLPDIALLPKLSMILDLDIEYLISDQSQYIAANWRGEIHFSNRQINIAGKPLIHYLISYLMLIGITDISIITTDREYINSLRLEQYGIRVSFFGIHCKNTVVIRDEFFLFGPNLTRYLASCAFSDTDTRLSIQGKGIPLFFIHSYNTDKYRLNKKTIHKILGRGMVYIPLTNQTEIDDASEFIRIYERYHNKKIADLSEISKNRRLI